MKLLDKIKDVFEKHPFQSIDIPKEYKNVYRYLDANPKEMKQFIPKKDVAYFIKKYQQHIPKGWYGFDGIGAPTIPEWNLILDEILEVLIAADPDFEIYQIKIKFGGICFYVETNIIEDIDEIEMLIMNKMHDKNLIY